MPTRSTTVLPSAFTWQRSPGRSRLLLHDVLILEVHSVRSGWMVDIVFDAGSRDACSIAVFSLARGEGWAIKWANQRYHVLERAVEERRRRRAEEATLTASQTNAIVTPS